MNINEIRTALANRANELHIQPVAATQPISQEKPQPQASKQTEQKPISTKKAPAHTKAAKTASPATPQTENKNKQPILAPVATPSKKPAAKAVNSLSVEQIIAENLQPGIDYNTIPGCGRKPALLKPGAEKLAAIYGLTASVEVINRVEHYDQQFVMYEVKTTLRDQSGSIVAEGLGSCNTRERKYARTDFSTNLNTVIKMARKRSFVDAVLTACHASGVFTQDIEDVANYQPTVIEKEA